MREGHVRSLHIGLKHKLIEFTYVCMYKAVHTCALDIQAMNQAVPQMSAFLGGIVFSSLITRLSLLRRGRAWYTLSCA